SDVGDPPRIPALGHTFLQIVVAVGGGHTAGVHPDGQVFQVGADNLQHPNQDAVTHVEVISGVAVPLPGQATGYYGGLHAEVFHPDDLLGYRHHTGLDHPALIDQMLAHFVG